MTCAYVRHTYIFLFKPGILENNTVCFPEVKLVFAIMLPAVGSAILFNIDASSGGTDVIAMILKKYTSMNIGSALMAADVAAVGLSFAMYGPSTGLFSIMGLVAK